MVSPGAAILCPREGRQRHGDADPERRFRHDALLPIVHHRAGRGDFTPINRTLPWWGKRQLSSREAILTTAKARKIQELREARGMSIDEVSHRLGVDAETVRRWEAGEEDVDDAALPRLADTLGVSQDELRHEGDARHHG